jgi:DNA-binding NtrC family response regulator
MIGSFMGEKILLVEDHTGNRINVSRFLRSQGYEVAQAENASEALVALAGGGIEIVISDFVLPGVHGLQLVKEIRSRWPNVSLIVISAYLSDEAGSIILQGEAEFLAKPFDLHALGAKVYAAVLKKNWIH